MSASFPSMLVLDDDDDWGTFSPLPLGSSCVLSLANSGEFNAFAVVGYAEENKSVQQLSPIGSKEKQGIFQIVPKFSFDSEVTEENQSGDEVEAEISTVGRVKKTIGQAGESERKTISSVHGY
jgi:hypothetical protein